jgi:anti-sigma B factor antagonist
MDFQFTETQIDEKTFILTLTGRLTAASSSPLREKIKQLTDTQSSQILIDMNAVTFIDSSGLAALVSGLKSARERGGWLKLIGVNATVQQTFKITQLDRVFGIYPTIEAALQS